MRPHSVFVLAVALVAVLSSLGGCDKNAPAAGFGLGEAPAPAISLLAANKSSTAGLATPSISRRTARS